MTALVLAIISSPEFRQMLLNLWLDIEHRKKTDPTFLAQSDAIVSQWGAAQTDEDKLNAQKAFQNLMSSHSS